MRTLGQILTDANSFLDLEATLPSGDELTLRANYANQAVWDASSAGQLSEFKREFVTSATSGGIVTIPLPANFREFEQDPKVLVNGGWIDYPEIDVAEKYDKSSADEYCYVLGNPSEGYFAIFNAMVSGATISMIHQRYPSGMATLSDKCELSDPGYVTRKVESYVLYSRGDERFPTANAESEKRLANMYGRDMKTSGGQGRSTKMTFTNPLK